MKVIGVAVILAFCGTASQADAGGCFTRSYSYSYVTPYVAPVVKVVPVAVFQPVVVPTYSVGYAPGFTGPPGPGADVQALMAAVKAMTVVVARLEAKVANLGAAPVAAAPQGQPQAQPRPQEAKEIGWVNVLQARCASCHTGNGAKGKFALFAQPNQLAALTPAQIGLCIQRMQLAGSKEQMPPPPAAPLTDQEFSEVNLGLARLLTQKAN